MGVDVAELWFTSSPINSGTKSDAEFSTFKTTAVPKCLECYEQGKSLTGQIGL